MMRIISFNRKTWSAVLSYILAMLKMSKDLADGPTNIRSQSTQYLWVGIWAMEVPLLEFLEL